MLLQNPIKRIVKRFLGTIIRVDTADFVVALTFDDGPDPVSTPALLELLARYNVQATFYVTGRRAEQYPQLIRRIVSRGHTIGNHSYTHDNFIMFQSTKKFLKNWKKKLLKYNLIRNSFLNDLAFLLLEW